MSIEFADVNETWFRENGCTDPVRAMKIWSGWITKSRSSQTCYQKFLELATGLSPGAIRHYLHGRNYKLSETTLTRLDAISRALGISPPKRRERKEELILASLVDRRLALLTPLEDVPSLSFYLEMIRSITEIAAMQNFTIALHSVSQSVLNRSLLRIVKQYHPSAAIMVRLTPDEETIGLLQKSSIPTVLIHADRLYYPCPPVLTNIVPVQERIRECLYAWVEQRFRIVSSSTPEVIVIAMGDEPPSTCFERIAGDPASIRAQRKALVLDVLRDFGPQVVEVEDYSFRHALKVVQAYPKASLYVCLSDEIAVGIKHLLMISDQDTDHRIIGFDDSLLAKREAITSFGHQVSEIGRLAINPLADWFSRGYEGETVWPDFEEIQADMRLEVRE